MTLHHIRPDRGWTSDLLSGTWYVSRTTLKLWRRRTNPTISYTPLPDGKMTDTVRSTSKDGRKAQYIIGLDTPMQQPGTFEWRGTSMLTRWTPSQWKVLAHDPEGEAWLVTHFSATPFTEEGVDICTRTPNLPADVENPLLELMRELDQAGPFVGRLFAPQRVAEASDDLKRKAEERSQSTDPVEPIKLHEEPAAGEQPYDRSRVEKRDDGMNL